MGRFNKQTGEFKAKPSVMKKIERMYQPIEFQDALRRGTQVKAYLGSGWEKGTVVEWAKNRVVVRLARGSRNVTVYDSRNLEVL